MKRFVGYLSLLCMSLVWASYYITSSLSVEKAGVLLAGVAIRLITLIVLTVIMAGKGELSQLFKTRAVFWRLILIGIFGYLLDITAFIGFLHSSAAVGTVLLKTDILFTNLITMVLLKKRFRWYDWALMIMMLFGVLLVLEINPLSFRLNGVWDIFFILSALFVTINAFVIKGVQHSKRAEISDNVIAYYNNLITLLLFSLTALFVGTGEASLNTDLWLILGLAGLAQAFLYIFYYYNLRRNEVWIVKITLLLVPVFSNLFYLIFLGKSLSPGQFTGMAAVILGAAMIIVLQHLQNQKKERE